MEFGLQLPPVALLSLLDPFLQEALNDCQLLVATSESPLLFIEGGFNVLCYQRFVIFGDLMIPVATLVSTKKSI